MSNIFRNQDFLYIQKRLYEPKAEELVARQIASVNQEAPRWIREIGYDIYEGKGMEAKVVAAGAGANDIPFAGESGTRESINTVDIEYGITYKWDDLAAARDRRILGNSTAFALDEKRIAYARRKIAEAENKLFFRGDTDLGIKGLLNWTGITSANVAEGAFGATAAEKRLWVNKTPKEIFTDIHTAAKEIEKDGIFKARTLVLPAQSYWDMLKPLNDMSEATLMSWLQKQGTFFTQIIKTNALNGSATAAQNHNGLGVNAFMIIDNDPEIIELCLPMDITLLPPQTDFKEEVKMLARERCAGAMLRYPKAVYIGKGI